MSAENIRQRIQAALRNTDQDYLHKTLLSRSEQRAGSYVENVTAADLRARIDAAPWQPYTHPALMPGVTAFKAPISGVLGMIAATALPPETPVTLQDPKGTGFLSAFVAAAANLKRPAVDFSVIILGPAEDGRGEIVYTFHPGAPVVPQGLAAAADYPAELTAGALAKLRPDMQVKITGPIKMPRP